MKKTCLSFFFLLLITPKTRAQQVPTFAFYKNHFNLFNPAAIIAHGDSYLNLGLREQWTNVEGAPLTQALSVGFPFQRERVGLGFSVLNDKFNVEQQSFFAVDFSYRLPLAQERNLFLGLKAGGNSYRLHISESKIFNANGQVNDPSLVDYARFLPNIGVGIYYASPKGYLAFSIPRLLNTSRQKKEDGQQTTATDRPHLFFSGGVEKPLGKHLVFQPSFLLSYVKAAPLQLTLDTAFLLYEKLEAGIQYNTSSGIGGTALININKGFKIGYAYSSPLQNAIERISNGTHELVLKIRLNKPQPSEDPNEDAEKELPDNPQ